MAKKKKKLTDKQITKHIAKFTESPFGKAVFSAAVVTNMVTTIQKLRVKKEKKLVFRLLKNFVQEQKQHKIEQLDNINVTILKLVKEEVK